MIKYLNSINVLDFPLAVIDKPTKLKDSPTSIVLDDITLVKRDNLYKTFNISEANLPKSYAMISTPGSFFARPVPYKNRAFLTDSLDLVIPIKKLKVELFTGRLVKLHKGLGIIEVKDICYLLPLNAEKTKPNPVIAKVNGVYFHSYWSDEVVQDVFYI